VPHWPQEYGGGGWPRSRADQILRQGDGGDRRAGAADLFGISMLGPALLKDVTDAQKRQTLPEIAARLIRLVPGLFREAQRGRILHHCRPARKATATIYHSTARRYGLSYANFDERDFLPGADRGSAKKHDGISCLLFEMA